MDDRDRALILEIKNRLPADLKGHVKRLVIFGSRTRGEATAASDLDVVALVDEKTPEIENLLEDVAYQVMWEHDFAPMISLKIFSESQFNDALSRGFSFYRHVEKEGVAV
jgi:uncharacterized protein